MSFLPPYVHLKVENVCNSIIVVSEDKPCNIIQYESTSSVSVLILAFGIDKEAFPMSV